MFSDTALVQGLNAVTQYTTARHKILSQNIANADTPNYKAKDLGPLNGRSKSNFKLLVTNSKHVGGGGFNQRLNAREDRTAYEESPDGNRVSLEHQFVRLTENQNQFTLANSLIRKWKNIRSLATQSPR